MRMYRGWKITDHGEGYHPVTGRWRAERHGVGMGANTEEMLLRMIDNRELVAYQERMERLAR